MRAIASIEPGMGRHSAGDLMKRSLSKLMTPSRSRMASFMQSRELRDVRHAVHLELQLEEEVQALPSHRGVLDHHHHLLEERVHGGLQHREALQVLGVVSPLELR